ncbi:MAG: patatin-like phospholipase family protein [Parachlamydiaceae bacterium]|nr:patatin-like phospholipase family protein [Parachlamydiaceae bacterium]
MFASSISLAGHHPNIKVEIPSRQKQYSTTITEKIKAVVINAFLSIVQFFQTLFNCVTSTKEELREDLTPARMGTYKLTYQLPMLETEDDQDPFIILTIDSGGVLGKIPIAMLRKIEEEIGGRIIEAVDIIAGASTGGIIAALLSLPSVNHPETPRYSAEDVDNLYDTFAQKIFSHSTYYKVTSLWGATSPKYPPPYEVMKDVVGDAQLQDALAKRLIVTSVDLLSGNLVLFENHPDNTTDFLEEKGIHTYSISEGAKFSDAIEATSAAPTYFPSKKFEKYNLIDGFMADKNSAQLVTLLATEKIARNRPILVISLGTGETVQGPIAEKNSLEWGWSQWVQPLIEYLINTRAKEVDLQMELMAKNNPLLNYVRIQSKLENALEAQMDNATPENMQRLGDLGTYTINHFLDNGGREMIIDPLRRKLLNKEF